MWRARVMSEDRLPWRHRVGGVKKVEIVKSPTWTVKLEESQMAGRWAMFGVLPRVKSKVCPGAFFGMVGCGGGGLSACGESA